MAAPTAPSLASVTIEGLKKAGINDPSATQNATLLSRAQTEWMPEIKWDISLVIKNLKSLQTSAILVTTEGKAQYALPTDFEAALKLTLLDGLNTGIAQDGAVGSVTLAAAETMSEASLLGHDILIYSGTGIGSMSRCTDYNSTTKVASVAPNFNTAPVSTDRYMRIDTYQNIEFKFLGNQYPNNYSTDRGTPYKAFIVGDADDGEIILQAVPYRSSGIPWGIQLDYYADIQRLDLASTLMGTLYRKYRNIFVQGVKAKQLESIDDDRADTELAKYNGLLNVLKTRESYGSDMSTLQRTIEL